MTNIIKTIDIESAYTKSHATIEHLINSRDDRNTVWEKTVNEHIRRVERSEAVSRMDGGQACGEDDPGNGSASINGSSGS